VTWRTGGALLWKCPLRTVVTDPTSAGPEDTPAGTVTPSAGVVSPRPVPAAAPESTALLDAREVLAAASDPVRHGLLRELAAGAPLPVYELAERLGRPPDLISKHLRVLRDARLVRAVAPADGDGRKLFRTRDAAGRLALDFGALLLRFG